MDASRRDARVASWLEEGPTTASDEVLAAVLAHVDQHPRRTTIIRRWADALWAATLERPLAPTFRLGLVLALLMVTLTLVGAVYLGALHPPVLWPSPTPSPLPGTVHRCLPGTDPDQPGPVDQARPSVDWRGGPMVADASSGLLVLLPTDGIPQPAVHPWLFDVCTNTWRQSAATVPNGALAYDPVSDRTFIFGEDAVVSFDADTDQTTTIGRPPFAVSGFTPSGTGPARKWHVTFDAMTGNFWVLDESEPSRLWTYDPDANTWDDIEALGDVPSTSSDTDLYAYDEGAHRLVYYRRGSQIAATYEIDPRTGTWVKIPAYTPPLEFVWGSLANFGIAYDAAIDRTLVFSAGQVIAYDARAETWESLEPALGEPPLTDFVPTALAYDPVNERIVAVGAGGDGQFIAGEGIVAFDPRSRSWTLLLAR